MIYICIPAHNEEQTVGVVLWKIRQVMAEFPRDYQILVADDGSTDKTSEVLNPYKRVLPLTVVRTDTRRGYAASLEMLLREAVRRSEYPKRDVIITIQADFSQEPEDIIPIIKAMDSGADIVCGQSKLPPETAWKIRWSRRMAARLLKRKSVPQGVSDPFTGFRAYRVFTIKKAMDDRVNGRLLLHDSWAANAELLAAAAPHARRIDPLDVTVRPHRLQRPSRLHPWPALRNVWSYARKAKPSIEMASVDELDESVAAVSTSRRNDAAGVRERSSRSDPQGRPMSHGDRQPYNARTERGRGDRNRTNGRPQNERPRAERNNGERNNGERNNGERPNGERVNGDRARNGERPRNEKPRNERGQRNERVRNDAPRAEATNGDRASGNRDNQGKERNQRGERGERGRKNRTERVTEAQVTNETQLDAVPTELDPNAVVASSADTDAATNAEGASPERSRRRRRRGRRSRGGANRNNNEVSGDVSAEGEAPHVDAMHENADHDAGDDGDDGAREGADDNSAAMADGAPAKKRRRGRRGGRGRRRQSAAGGENSQSSEGDAETSTSHTEVTDEPRMHQSPVQTHMFIESSDNA